MAAANQPDGTTTEFRVNYRDVKSTVEVKRTLKSTDEDVLWDLILWVIRRDTGTKGLQLRLEATALTPETPHVKKFLTGGGWCCLAIKPKSCTTCFLIENVKLQNRRSCDPNPSHELAGAMMNNSQCTVFVNLADSFLSSSLCSHKCFSVEVTLSHDLKAIPNLSRVGPCVNKNFKAMLDSGEMSDVTFVVGGVEIKAHRLILSASSDVFKAMFQHDTRDRATRRVKVADVSPPVFEEMLRCVYTDAEPAWVDGEHSEDFLAGLLFLAEKYNLVSLRGHCQRRILSTLTVDNVVKRLKVLHIVSPPMVRNVVDPFVRTHFSEINSSRAFSSLTDENPDLVAYVTLQCIE